MLVSLKPIMKYAKNQDCAVGAFNCSNLESVMAIIRAAKKMQSPVILNYAEVHDEFIRMEEIAPIMLQFAEQASVPVCVHLDHGQSLESCIKAIRLGFTSVMIDASAAEYEENVRQTKEVVRMAHAVDVTVEAELGHILTSETGAKEGGINIESSEHTQDLNDIYTDPEMAKDFVEKTGVDVLAIAFGTAHGIYTRKPVLDLERIDQIKSKVSVPFVMHGGSGLSKEEFQTAIRNGVRKINYYTYMTLAGGRAVKAAMDKKEKEDPIFFHDISVIAANEMERNVTEAISIFLLKD